MLETAQSPDDIADVKMRIQQTIFDIEEEQKWRKHLSGEGKKPWRVTWVEGKVIVSAVTQRILSQVTKIYLH